MLRKFLDVFFPGFQWEHGFALWDMGSAVSIGASLLGGAMGDDAAGDAADAQSASAGLAIAELKKIGERTRSDTQPYRDLGEAGANRLRYLMGLGGTAGAAGDYATKPLSFDEYIDWAGFDRPGQRRIKKGRGDWTAPEMANLERAYDNYLKTLPTVSLEGKEGYGSLLADFSERDLEDDVVYNKALKFGLDEGSKALERRALANGGYDSGATLKALTRFGNDYGETKAGGAYERFMGDKSFTFNTLMGGTGVGQNAVALDANTGSQIAQAVGNAQMGAGNAQAAGIVGGANAWSNAFGGIGNAVNQYQSNKILDRVLRGGGFGGAF
jgi:hypothetical protein